MTSIAMFNVDQFSTSHASGRQIGNVFCELTSSEIDAISGAGTYSVGPFSVTNTWSNTAYQTVVWSAAGAIAGAATGPGAALGAVGGAFGGFFGSFTFSYSPTGNSFN